MAVATLVLLTATLGLAPPPETQGSPTVTSRLDGIVEDWAERSAEIERLDLLFQRVDADQKTATRAEFTGRLLLQRPDLAALDVRRVGADGRSVADERAVCDGKVVAWFHPEVRRILLVPFLPDVDRGLNELNVERPTPRDDLPAYVATFLLAANLQRHGPIPFLWDVRPDALKARYALELLDESPSVCRLRFRPRTELERSRCREAVVTLSKESFMPTAVRMVDPGGTQTQDYVIGASKVDPAIDPAIFVVRSVPGWEVVRPARP